MKSRSADRRHLSRAGSARRSRATSVDRPGVSPARPQPAPKTLPSAWCRGCNRVLPRVKRGVCFHCHRTFNRSDWSSFRREPAEATRDSHAAAIVLALSAAAVYLGWHLLDGFVIDAIWQSEARWPIGWLILVSVRTWLVTFLTLCALRHTGFDRLPVLWTLGIVLGGLLALPYGPVALLVGILAGAPAAVLARALSLGVVMSGGGSPAWTP